MAGQAWGVASLGGKGVYVGSLVLADVKLLCLPKRSWLFQEASDKGVSIEPSISKYPLFAKSVL